MKRILLSLLLLLLIGGSAWGQAGGPFNAPTHRTFVGPSSGELYVAESSLMAGLNQQTGTTYTVLGSDVGKLITFSNTASVAVTMPQAGTTGFEANKSFYFLNKNVGLVTITPTTSNVSGLTTIVLKYGDAVNLISDGTNYQAEGGIPTGKNCTISGATPVTCNGPAGIATTGTLTTAAATAAAAYVINNSLVTANSILSCDIQTYSGTLVTNGIPIIGTCVPGAGTITVIIVNVHAANALNGTVGIAFQVSN